MLDPRAVLHQAWAAGELASEPTGKEPSALVDGMIERLAYRNSQRAAGLAVAQVVEWGVCYFCRQRLPEGRGGPEGDAVIVLGEWALVHRGWPEVAECP